MINRTRLKTVRKVWLMTEFGFLFFSGEKIKSRRDQCSFTEAGETDWRESRTATETG